MQRTYITYTSVYIQLFSFQKYHIWAAFLFCEKKIYSKLYIHLQKRKSYK